MHKDEETPELVEASESTSSSNQIQFTCSDCGYTGPLETFMNSSTGMRCPKCKSTNLIIK